MQHWRYFLMLEEEILSLRKYIEFEEDNFKTYSLELCKQLTSICSEIDILFKGICEALGDNNAKNMPNYRKTLKDYESKVKIITPRIKILLIDTEISLSPLIGIYKQRKVKINDKIKDRFLCLKWWEANNKVKHDRINNYASGNLGNVLKAGATLFILNLTYYALKQSVEIYPSNNLYRLDNDDFAYRSSRVYDSMSVIRFNDS